MAQRRPDVARICQTLSSLLVKNVPGESYGGFSHVSASGCAGRTSNELTASNWHLFLPLSVFLSLHSSFSLFCANWWSLRSGELIFTAVSRKKNRPCVIQKTCGACGDISAKLYDFASCKFCATFKVKCPISDAKSVFNFQMNRRVWMWH